MNIFMKGFVVGVIFAGLLSHAAYAVTRVGECPVFPANHILNSRIDALPVHPNSNAFIQTISTNGKALHLDLGIETDQSSSDYYGIPYNLVSGNSVKWKPITFDSNQASPDESDCAVDEGGGHQVKSPCIGADSAPLTNVVLPIPDSPQVESGTVTSDDGNDHHLLVIDTDACNLWEIYSAIKNNSGWLVTSSIAFFDLRSNALRPLGWTSSDAAGFPIYPLLLKATEANSGSIEHALRLTLLSSKIRRGDPFWPARHNTGRGSGNNVPQMGQVFRLKASYVIPGNFHPQSIAILTAMQRYGIYLSDIGSDMFVQGEPNSAWEQTTFDEVQHVTSQEFEAVDISPIMNAAGFDSNSAAVPAVLGSAGSSGAGTNESNDSGNVHSTAKHGCAATSTNDIQVFFLGYWLLSLYHRKNRTRCFVEINFIMKKSRCGFRAFS